jgi:hypothetical protein
VRALLRGRVWAWLPRGRFQEESFFDTVVSATALLPDREGWAPVTNLDVFFTRMYHFYFERGFSVIVAKRLTNLMYGRVGD